MSIPPLPPNTSLAAKSVLITGATAGLGYAAALLSLQLGASPLYLAVRSLSKGDSARTKLLADPIVRSKNPGAVVKVYELDMERWESVLSFAKTFTADRKAASEGLDIAILNAGVLKADFSLSPTGNETTVQVNHLSTALLSLLLLPLLESSTTPDHIARLTIVSSSAHQSLPLRTCPPDGENYLATLNDKARFVVTERYGLSKLLVIFFLRGLASRVAASKVIINNVCPGPIKTDLGAKLPLWGKVYMWFMWLRANSVEAGASCYVHGAAVVGEESHGLFYFLSQPSSYSPFVTSSEGKKMEAKVWQETMQILEKASPGVGARAGL